MIKGRALEFDLIAGEGRHEGYKRDTSVAVSIAGLRKKAAIRQRKAALEGRPSHCK